MTNCDKPSSIMTKPIAYFIKVCIIAILTIASIFVLRHYNKPSSHQQSKQASNMAGATHSHSYQKISGKTMGTSYHISLLADKDSLTVIQNAIEQKLHNINKSMSTYDDNATIMVFNRANKDKPIAIDADFVKVFTDSQQIFQQSNGAFDPTVKPLVDLWGFGRNLSIERLQSPPSPQEIASIQPLIGLNKITLTNHHLQKSMDGISLDFSAIAKGYAVDVIANSLQNDFQINDYMIEIGGEIATKGNNPEGKAWQIAIDKPTLASNVEDRQLLLALPVHQAHIATSGNYRNTLEWQGVRYSHTINPHTYHPVINGAPSVTVFHDSTALADGWATALTAVPYAEALALANRNDILALFVIQDKQDWQIVYSNAFKKHLANQANKPSK